MSLISDALKKARLEAQGQDGRLQYLTRPAPPRRRSSAWPWVAAVSVSLAVGALMGVVLLGRSVTLTPSVDPSSRAEASAPAPIPAAAEEDATEAAPPAPGAERPSPQPELPSPTVAPLPVQQKEPSAIATLDPSPRPTVAVPKTPAPPADAPPADAPPPSRAATEVPRAGESYLQRVTFPDGSQIALRGIAWHATEPAALLNDRVLAVGDGLEGWTLVGVEPGRVAIEWRDVRFYLRLK
jgi:hypothetical protein